MWRTAIMPVGGILLLLCLCIKEANPQRRDPLKIGVILDEKAGRQGPLAFAWSHFSQKFGGGPKYEPLDIIDVSDNHKLITSLCSKMSEGVIMMIVDNHPNSYSSVQSYAHYLQVPTLIPSGRGSVKPYQYDISLLPPTTQAIVDIIKHFHWNKVVYYMFDTNDGLLRLQKLYQSFDAGDVDSPLIRARKVNNVSDCYDVLRKIDHQDPLPKRIILDLSSTKAYESVLQQIVDVGMNREGYHYILGGLGITELDLTTFVYGGVNITGFSIIDNASAENSALISSANSYRIQHLGKIQTDEALVIDTVHVLLLAVKSLNDNSSDDNLTVKQRNRNRHYRVGSPRTDGTCCNSYCSGDPWKQAFDGKWVLQRLKNVKTYGLTGAIEFDENGIRQNYIFRVHQLEHKLPLREVGFWTPQGGFNTSLPKLQKLKPKPDMYNRTLRVVTIFEPPFAQEKNSNSQNGAPLVDGRFLEGYCVDLAKKINQESTTPYEYHMDLVGDASYGRAWLDKGCWDGMIGELIDTINCPSMKGSRKKADIVIAPLTITETRQRVVDFTKPFMQTGISIMIKKPDKEKPGVFSFMYPLSNWVWFCVMIAFVAVSLVLFLVGRWSPYEWTDQDPKGGTPINDFTLFNTFWFSLGALMQQGSDTFPRSFSGRVVGSAWWFFTLILISSYTANLAAFLTIERLLPPIGGADDLANQQEIEYGTLNSGSSRGFFEETNVPTYKKMWQYMKANADRVLLPQVEMGVEKVRASKGKYAFLMESAYNVYHNQRKPCNTMKVGHNLDSKGYGIATPLNFYLRLPLNLAVLHLQETGELKKLEQKWWYAKGMCGTDTKDAKTSALTLSNVSGVFHILVGGLVLAMVVALLEYLIHNRIRTIKRNSRAQKMKPQTVRIVKKQPLEALKEVGYSDHDASAYPPFQYNTEYQSAGAMGSVAAPLVTFDGSR